jgi:uncharacterized membrane protein YeaQ/YmgE (transglycosylase-associated protein family)
MDLDNALAWIAIGAAASLAGMIWPFRRGVMGIVVNLLAGIVGALLGGLLSFLFMPYGMHGNTPARLLFAAMAALASLGVVHVLGAHAASAQRRHVEMIAKVPRRPPV